MDSIFTTFSILEVIMKLHNPAHPCEIVLEYFLDSPEDVESSGKTDFIKSLINNKPKIDDEKAEILSEVFKTFKDFWLNLQKQYDDADEKPLSYTPKTVFLPLSAINTVLKTGEPCYTYLNGLKGTEEEKVVVLTIQAFNYLMKGRTEDELWDLGFLGNSKEHTVSKRMPEKLKQLIKKSYNKVSKDSYEV